MVVGRLRGQEGKEGLGRGQGGDGGDLGANWSPSRSMNLLAFSHAREDHESAPAAPRLSSGPADFISL